MPAPVVDVVVPARDAAATLPALLAAVPPRVARSIVVVDRASRDRTAEIALDGGALLLRTASSGYGAACQRAQAHFQALPRVPDIIAFVPGDRPEAVRELPQLIAPIESRGAELVLGVERGHRAISEKVVTALIETVYRYRWNAVGPVRALNFPALVALGMRDRGDGWDVEMLVRATKLGLSCEEVELPEADTREGRVGTRALFHILRHATMR
jgi:glycosyltransferase involved in cell wall biosynthesis